MHFSCSELTVAHSIAGSSLISYISMDVGLSADAVLITVSFDRLSVSRNGSSISFPYLVPSATRFFTFPNLFVSSVPSVVNVYAK